MYNPLILAYDRKKGAFSMPLQDAKEKYGMVSEHHLLSMKKMVGSDKKEDEERLKVLNLDIGLAIRMFFSDNKNTSLKNFLCDFYDS